MTDTCRSDILAGLAKHLQIRLAILFGSMATGRPVDLGDRSRIGEPALGPILKHGECLLGDDERHAWPAVRHLGGEADFKPYYRRILAERRRAWIGR